MHDTIFTGSQIIRLQAVDSTNNYAAKLIKEMKPAEGTVIMAHDQTAGRGQMGNQWLAQAGKNLTFSLVLYPKYLSPGDIFVLSQVTALAVSDLLLQYGIANQVKWPNDIMTSRGKICGILIENLFSRDKIAHSIVGVGLNVNQHMNYAGIQATSMIDFLDRPLDLDLLLGEFCRFFDKWYLQMTAGRYGQVHQTYLQRLLHFGVKARYLHQGSEITAVIENAMPDGRLKLRLDNGDHLYAGFKEITFLL